MLDTQGLVSEATGENIFLVRDGVIKTPPLQTVLDGITRATIIELARDKGLVVEETGITRDDLYVADEVFLTGTAAEVTPVREIDHRTIGEGHRGPVAKLLQTAFFDVVSGKDSKYDRWHQERSHPPNPLPERILSTSIPSADAGPMRGARASTTESRVTHRSCAIGMATE